MKPKPALLFVVVGLLAIGLLFLLRPPSSSRRQQAQTAPSVPHSAEGGGKRTAVSAAESNFLAQPEAEGREVFSRASSTTSIPKVPSFKLNLTNCPSSIRPIVDVSHDFRERQTFLRSLLRTAVPLAEQSPSTDPNQKIPVVSGEGAKSLARSEIETFYAFLLEKHPEDRTQRGHVLKSDLMDLLCAQPEPPRDLRNVLTELLQDRDQDVVVRDYAVQHLAWVHEQKPSNWLHDELQTQRRQIEAVLWDALAETDSSISGTALLALSRVLGPDDATSQSRLAGDALRLAADGSVSPLVRISAIQVCAQRRLEAALPFLGRTAELDPSFAVRLSAIGALGQIGDADSRATLQRIAAEKDPKLNPAVTLALSRLEPKL